MIDDRQGTPMTAAARPHRTPVSYAAAALAVGLLGACTSGDPGPAVTTARTASSSASSASPPPTTTTPTPSPTTSVDPVLAKIPAAARLETQSGAAAFARFYFEQLNRSFMDASPEILDGLFDPSCRICTDLQKSSRELEAQSRHHAGNTLTVTLASATVFNKKDRQVLVTLDQHSVAVLNKSGKRVDTTKSGKGAFVAALRFTDHWVITDLGRPS
ncbi:DUF6318 family protein [Terrabacter carboxydivorans]|uniref:DUF6318 domain-containing protein n=1 Tax=Terrabacter carboxydivorans TaxID=619730 RepID=A0ABP5YG04_9MICO